MIALQAGGWTSLKEAPGAYWVFLGLGVAVIVGFALWVLLRWRPVPVGTAGYHVLGGAVMLLVVVTLLTYIGVPASGYGRTPTPDAWDWKPGETLADPGGTGLTGEPYRGYQVYVAQACMYCHTTYARPQDVPTGWSPGLAAEDVSEPGDYANVPAPVWGTQRNGPDLTIEGKRVPLMQWHIDHLREPRRFKEQSIMPTFRHLPERDLRDLAAFLVSLGNDPAKLRRGEVGPGAGGELSPEARQGLELAQSLGCLACHTTTGESSVGPTWKGVFGKQETLSDGSTVLVDDGYIRESVLKPAARVVQGFQPIMPSFEGRVSQDDLAAIVAYIKSLEGAQGSGR